MKMHKNVGVRLIWFVVFSVVWTASTAYADEFLGPENTDRQAYEEQYGVDKLEFYNRKNAIIVKPLFGEAFLDGSRNTPDDGFRGVAARFNYNQYLGIEAWLGRTSKAENEQDQNVFRAIGLQWNPLPRWRIQPYATLGLGQTKLPSGDDNQPLETSTRATFAHGWEWHVNDIFAFVAEARLFNGGDRNDAVATTGIQVQFGGVRVIKERPCYDSDGDGICDEDDFCPDTPADVAVDEYGCPKPKRLVKRLVLTEVNFEFDKFELTADAQKRLQAFLQEMNVLEFNFVQIEAHTDAKGSAEYNRKLSFRRSDAVKQFFVSAGLQSEAIEALSYGETWPIANNSSEAGRYQNRRVEVKVWDFTKAPLLCAQRNDGPCDGRHLADKTLFQEVAFRKGSAEPSFLAKQQLASYLKQNKGEQALHYLQGWAIAEGKASYQRWLASRRALALRSLMMLQGVAPGQIVIAQPAFGVSDKVSILKKNQTQ